MDMDDNNDGGEDGAGGAGSSASGGGANKVKFKAYVKDIPSTDDIKKMLLEKKKAIALAKLGNYMTPEEQAASEASKAMVEG